jgi:hypothetical protein
MSEVTGVVQSVVSRQVTGGKTMYDIIVAGQKYGVGMYAPKAKEGDYVKFEVDESRGFKNVARGSLKVSANKAPPEAVAEAAATQIKSASTGASYDSRQDCISRQAATNTAIEFLRILGEADALGLPAANTKGKKAEVLEAMLKKYTTEFYEQNTGVKWKDISPSRKDEGDAPADTAEEEVADKDWE